MELSLPGDRIIEAEGSGLVVRSTPTGARVFIDGIERGRTPLRLDTLHPGRYFVRLQREGHADRTFMVTVRTGSVMDVSLQMRAAVGRVLLAIQPAPGSPPPDALPLSPQITVDGQPHPSPALELPIGFRTIRVRAFGWVDVTQTLYIQEDSFRELELTMQPAMFALSGGSFNRPSFNPANAGALGTTAFAFEVSAPGSGNFTVLDEAGQAVFSRPLGDFQNRWQSVIWNGRDLQGQILPDGTYTVVINAVSLPWDASPPVQETLARVVHLDSTQLIHPLTLSSGKSGLLFAPFPSVLPPGSFQIDGSLLAGGLPPPAAGDTEAHWGSLPFSAAFRFSPLQRLQTIAALNVIPRFEGPTGTGVSGGVTWAFFNSSEGIAAATAGAVISWTNEDSGITPFGMTGGVEVFLPFSVNLGRRFSFALTPAALWAANESFALEPVPRLLVSGGLMLRMTYMSAGLSIRSEYDFNTSPVPPFIAAAAEIRFFPPPSSFMFFLMGGVWVRNGNPAGFGGLGIGMIY